MCRALEIGDRRHADLVVQCVLDCEHRLLPAGTSVTVVGESGHWRAARRAPRLRAWAASRTVRSSV